MKLIRKNFGDLRTNFRDKFVKCSASSLKRGDYLHIVFVLKNQKRKKETTYEIKTITRPEGLKPYLPTDVQAEVLVFNTIAPSYITQCYCHWNLGDMAARAASHYSNIAIFPNAEWVANKIQHIFYGFRDDVDWK